VRVLCSGRRLGKGRPVPPTPTPRCPRSTTLSRGGRRGRLTPWRGSGIRITISRVSYTHSHTLTLVDRVQLSVETPFLSTGMSHVCPPHASPLPAASSARDQRVKAISRPAKEGRVGSPGHLPIQHPIQHPINPQLTPNQVTCDVHGTSTSAEQFRDPATQPQAFKNEARKGRPNVLGKTLTSVHHNMGLRK